MISQMDGWSFFLLLCRASPISSYFFFGLLCTSLAKLKKAGQDDPFKKKRKTARVKVLGKKYIFPTQTCNQFFDGRCVCGGGGGLFPSCQVSCNNGDITVSRKKRARQMST